MPFWAGPRLGITAPQPQVMVIAQGRKSGLVSTTLRAKGGEPEEAGPSSAWNMCLRPVRQPYQHQDTPHTPFPQSPAERGCSPALTDLKFPQHPTCTEIETRERL